MFYLLLMLVLAVPIGAVLLKLATRNRSRPAVRRLRGTGLIDRFSGPPFDAGTNHQARVVAHGTHRGRPFVAFHLSYDVPERDQVVTRTFTVVAVNTPAPCPDLMISRPTLRGGNDLDLESEQFNEAFKIDTTDQKFAYDVLHPGMMAWLLDDGRALRMPLTFGNQDLFSYAINAVDHRALLEFLCDVMDRVASFVWKP